MDQPGLIPSDHEAALRGLARINALSDSAGILWRPLVELGRPLSVLDVATGGGDVLAGLWRRARKAGLELRLEGCDVSPVAVDHATRQAAICQVPIRFFRWNALRDPLP